MPLGLLDRDGRAQEHAFPWADGFLGAFWRLWGYGVAVCGVGYIWAAPSLNTKQAWLSPLIILHHLHLTIGLQP